MLTDAACKAAKKRAGGRAYRLPDAGGLHLYVSPTGTRLWRMRYDFAGREKLLSFGPYPDVSLASAREQRDAARALIRAHRDPALEKKLRRAAGLVAAANNFEAVARAWHALQTPNWTERHAGDVLTSLEDAVFPLLGTLPVSGITPVEVLTCVRQIEARGALETARRVRQRMSAVFVYAIGAGMAGMDPANVVAGAMAPMRRKGRQPALTDLGALRDMLRAAEAVPAHPATRFGLRLLALTAVRPGELRGVTWPEFGALDADALWRVPAERMKVKFEHLVPLATQAVELLVLLRRITGRHPYAFPNTRHPHKPMSENALGYLLNRAGYHGHHVPHGFRASFSTIMNELYPADRAVIDLMLAHEPENRVESAYNRASYMPRRRELAQAWADTLLEGLSPASDLAALPRR
jgi:integrase